MLLEKKDIGNQQIFIRKNMKLVTLTRELYLPGGILNGNTRLKKSGSWHTLQAVRDPLRPVTPTAAGSDPMQRVAVLCPGMIAQREKGGRGRPGTVWGAKAHAVRTTAREGFQGVADSPPATAMILYESFGHWNGFGTWKQKRKWTDFRVRLPYKSQFCYLPAE